MFRKLPNNHKLYKNFSLLGKVENITDNNPCFILTNKEGYITAISYHGFIKYGIPLNVVPSNNKLINYIKTNNEILNNNINNSNLIELNKNRFINIKSIINNLDLEDSFLLSKLNNNNKGFKSVLNSSSIKNTFDDFLESLQGSNSKIFNMLENYLKHIKNEMLDNNIKNKLQNKSYNKDTEYELNNKFNINDLKSFIFKDNNVVLTFIDMYYDNNETNLKLFRIFNIKKEVPTKNKVVFKLLKKKKLSNNNSSNKHLYNDNNINNKSMCLELRNTSEVNYSRKSNKHITFNYEEEINNITSKQLTSFGETNKSLIKFNSGKVKQNVFDSDFNNINITNYNYSSLKEIKEINEINESHGNSKQIVQDKNISNLCSNKIEKLDKITDNNNNNKLKIKINKNISNNSIIKLSNNISLINIEALKIELTKIITKNISKRFFKLSLLFIILILSVYSIDFLYSLNESNNVLVYFDFWYNIKKINIHLTNVFISYYNLIILSNYKKIKEYIIDNNNSNELFDIGFKIKNKLSHSNNYVNNITNKLIKKINIETSFINNQYNNFYVNQAFHKVDFVSYLYSDYLLNVKHISNSLNVIDFNNYTNLKYNSFNNIKNLYLVKINNFLLSFNQIDNPLYYISEDFRIKNIKKLNNIQKDLLNNYLFIHYNTPEVINYMYYSNNIVENSILYKSSGYVNFVKAISPIYLFICISFPILLMLLIIKVNYNKLDIFRIIFLIDAKYSIEITNYCKLYLHNINNVFFYKKINFINKEDLSICENNQDLVKDDKKFIYDSNTVNTILNEKNTPTINKSIYNTNNLNHTYRSIKSSDRHNIQQNIEEELNDVYKINIEEDKDDEGLLNVINENNSYLTINKNEIQQSEINSNRLNYNYNSVAITSLAETVTNTNKKDIECLKSIVSDKISEKTDINSNAPILINKLAIKLKKIDNKKDNTININKNNNKKDQEIDSSDILEDKLNDELLNTKQAIKFSIYSSYISLIGLSLLICFCYIVKIIVKLELNKRMYNGNEDKSIISNRAFNLNAAILTFMNLYLINFDKIENNFTNRTNNLITNKSNTNKSIYYTKLNNTESINSNNEYIINTNGLRSLSSYDLFFFYHNLTSDVEINILTKSKSPENDVTKIISKYENLFNNGSTKQFCNLLLDSDIEFHKEMSSICYNNYLKYSYIYDNYTNISNNILNTSPMNLKDGISQMLSYMKLNYYNYIKIKENYKINSYINKQESINNLIDKHIYSLKYYYLINDNWLDFLEYNIFYLNKAIIYQNNLIYNTSIDFILDFKNTEYIMLAIFVIILIIFLLILVKIYFDLNKVLETDKLILSVLPLKTINDEDKLIKITNEFKKKFTN